MEVNPYQSPKTDLSTDAAISKKNPPRRIMRAVAAYAVHVVGLTVSVSYATVVHGGSLLPMALITSVAAPVHDFQLMAAMVDQRIVLRLAPYSPLTTLAAAFLAVCYVSRGEWWWLVGLAVASLLQGTGVYELVAPHFA